MTSTPPTLDFERTLFADGIRVLGAVDEVGRGAPAGPATCAIVVIDAGRDTVPAGLRDSKLLSASVREELVPRIHQWVLAGAVGHASASEVDEYGLTVALRVAGQRALAQLEVPLDAIVLDGSFDWLSPPKQADLLLPASTFHVRMPPVTTKVKADLTCASVAAASVLAKVARDAVMVRLAQSYPEYGWASNKGYGSAQHLDAVRRLGLTPHHRASWRFGALEATP